MTALEQTPPEETPNVTQMRETIDRQGGEIKGLKGQLRDQAFEAAGLDPSEGIGQLLANAYEGEATKEAVTEFAKSKGVELKVEAPTEAEAAAAAKAAAQKTLVTDGLKRIDSAHDQSKPLVSEPSIDDEIAQADKDGDFKLGISLRNAKQLAREQSGDYVIGQ